MKVETDLYYRLEISYLGLNYFGWQKQINLPTIQLELEQALQHFLELDKVWTLATSRTDAGVNALRMTVLLKLRGEIIVEQFPLAELQAKLPGHLRIHSITPHQEDLQIIQDVNLKEYLYFFTMGPDLPYFEFPFITHYAHLMDLELMKTAAQCFKGRHQFHNFRSPRKPGQDTTREIYHCEISTADQWVAGKMFGPVFMLRIQGNGFMRNMVRFVMGSLAQIGQQKLSLEELREAICTDKIYQFPLASPHGLFLHYAQFKHPLINEAKRTPPLSS